MNEPTIFIVSAPSGCGKGTILHEVFKDIKVFYSVSCTTRQPRDCEKDGVDYHFISVEQFDKMAENDDFIEHAGFADNQYGTPKKPIYDNLAEGRDVVLEIETNGAFQVKEKRPDAVSVFILPPSIPELRRRLLKRGTEPVEKIDKRVAAASAEIARADRYDFVIMNDELDDAIADFKTVYSAVKSGDRSADRFRPTNDDIIKMIDEVLKNA